MGLGKMTCCGALTHTYGDAGKRIHNPGCLTLKASEKRSQTVWVAQDRDTLYGIATTLEAAKKAAEAQVDDYFGKPVVWTEGTRERWEGAYHEHAYRVTHVYVFPMPLIEEG